MELVLVVAGVVLVTGVLLGAVLLSEHRRRRAERADATAAKMVEREFRRAFGEQLPAVDPYPRERTRVDAERPTNRSNWTPGQVRPQG